jgi:cytochrome c-type biogenesis protein CcmH
MRGRVPALAMIALAVMLVAAVTPALAQSTVPAASAPAASAPAAPAGAAPARTVSEQEVYEVAAQLRCVVCQTLSVADSPSEMAGQMRGIVRERLVAGDTPAQVRQYFVERYGDWILLAPPRRGFTLLVWLAPFFAVLVGVVIVAVRLKGWTRRRRPTPPPVDPAMRERIQRELEREA